MSAPSNTPVDPRRLHHGDTRSPLCSLLNVNAEIRLPNWNANLALTAFAKPLTPASSLKPPEVRRPCSTHSARAQRCFGARKTRHRVATRSAIWGYDRFKIL